MVITMRINHSSVSNSRTRKKNCSMLISGLEPLSLHYQVHIASKTTSEMLCQLS